MTRSYCRSLLVTLSIATVLAVAACDQVSETPLAPDADSQVRFAAAPTVGVFTFEEFLPTDGTSRLIRTPKGISYQLKAVGLTPGNAYTLWFVVFNEPGGCTGGAPCGAADVVNNAARPDMVYAAGKIAGGSGQVTFAGHRSVGDLSGSANAPVGLPAYGLEDPGDAIVFLVVHDHGPADASFMPWMIQSIDGGCTDAGVPEAGAPSPWNDYEGPPAGAFGIRGTNSCASVQIAVHVP